MSVKKRTYLNYIVICLLKSNAGQSTKHHILQWMCAYTRSNVTQIIIIIIINASKNNNKTNDKKIKQKWICLHFKQFQSRTLLYLERMKTKLMTKRAHTHSVPLPVFISARSTFPLLPLQFIQFACILASWLAGWLTYLLSHLHCIQIQRTISWRTPTITIIQFKNIYIHEFYFRGTQNNVTTTLFYWLWPNNSSFDDGNNMPMR